MQQRQLGKDGPMMSVLGFGAWPIGGGMGHVDEAEAIRTVHASIDHGITLLDTAEGYRSSETIIGKALKGGYRDRCFLATKVSNDYSPAGIRAAMANSLHALQVDYIDLYQIHSWNPQYPIADSMATMLQLQAEGKTRFIGVSNFYAPQMEQALLTGFYHSNQLVYSLFERGIETAEIPFCEAHGIGILAHSPLAKGLLTGRYQPGHQFPPDDERSRSQRFRGEVLNRYLGIAARLEEVARQKGITLMQLAVAWCLRQPVVASVLIGAKTPEQILDHVAAAEITLTPDEEIAITQILANLRPLPMFG